MNLRNQSEFLRCVSSRMILILGCIIVSTDSKSVSLANKTSIHGLVWVVNAFSNKINPSVVNLQSLIIIACQLQQCGLTVDLVKHIFKVIIVTHQIQLQFRHFVCTHVFVFSLFKYLRKRSILQLTWFSFNTYLTNSKHVINIENNAFLLWKYNITKVQRRL